MSKPIIPPSSRPGVLNDPRSTGGSPRPRLPDILGTRGTLKSGR